jgi:hypothetical protein
MDGFKEGVPEGKEGKMFLQRRLNGKHPVTLINKTIYQKSLISRERMLFFPFRPVSLELFYILFRGLELRDFRHLFPRFGLPVFLLVPGSPV